MENYRPITCLPIMWKVLTGIMAEDLYQHLHQSSLLPDEQKGCRKESRGTKDQLVIDRAILRDCKQKKSNLAIAWKAYDFVPHSWILETLDLVGDADNIKRLMRESMESWNTQLTACGKDLGEVSIRRGIFLRDSLSPLLFVIAMLPLSSVLNESAAGYRLNKKEGKIIHLLFMDDLKLCGRNGKEINSLVHTVRMFSSDIGMDFGIEKCAMMVMKRGKLDKSEGIRLPDGRIIRSIGNDVEGYKYLGC